jgi:hypothetical protein
MTSILSGSHSLPSKGKTMKLITSILDGKNIGYSSETKFLIESGKGPKGSYKVRMTFTGDLERAVLWYNSLNIGNGYKKRLVMCGSKNGVLARYTS